MDSIPNCLKNICIISKHLYVPDLCKIEESSSRRTSSNFRKCGLSDDVISAGQPCSSEKVDKGVQTSEKVLSESSSNNEPSPYRKRKRHLLQLDQVVDDRLWPIQIQNAFLKTLLVWKARNGRWSGGRFTTKPWTEIRDDFNSQTRRNYTTKQLQDNSSGLTGVRWDSRNQTIRARPEQWDTMIEVRPSVRRIHRKGFPNFELMTDVFHDSGAQGTMSRSSNLDPLTDEQEREVLKKNEGSSKRTVPTDEETDFDEFELNHQFDSPEAVGSHKKMKVAGKDVKAQSTVPTTVAEESAWQAFELMNMQKAKKYEAQREYIESRTVVMSEDKYSLAACLRLLENDFPNISATGYLRASRFFQDPRYCMRWIEMKPEFRKFIVDSNFIE